MKKIILRLVRCELKLHTQVNDYILNQSVSVSVSWDLDFQANPQNYCRNCPSCLVAKSDGASWRWMPLPYFTSVSERHFFKKK
jgi:hypothetical protein